MSFLAQRLTRARSLDVVVVATPDTLIASLVQQLRGVRVYLGAEPVNDVLHRFVNAARRFQLDTIVRAYADCPLLDPLAVDAFVANFRDVDYLRSGPGYPEGMDVEVVSRDALERAHVEASDAQDREHVTRYIWSHPDQFRIALDDWPTGDFHAARVTVDYPDDLAVMRKVIDRLGTRCTVASVIDLYVREPELWNAGPRTAPQPWAQRVKDAIDG